MAADKGMLSGLILDGSRFEGKLTFVNKMRIDGEFHGEIESKDQLIVGKSAKIDAEISVGELIVMGEVRGHVKHCDMLQVVEGGRLIGDIRVKTLDLRPGAIFDGRCEMITDKS